MGARVPSFWDLMLDDLRWSWCNNTRNRVLITQSCLILCDPMDCSLPGSSVRWISQARVLEWVAISFSRVSSQPRDWTQVCCTAGRLLTMLPESLRTTGAGCYGQIWTMVVLAWELPFVCLNCYNRTPQMGWLKHQKWQERLEVHDQGVCCVGFCWPSLFGLWRWPSHCIFPGPHLCVWLSWCLSLFLQGR